MDKCKLNELLDKILKLEKMLMRDLDEREIDYLINHTIDEFLNNILGFNFEDRIVLSKLKKAISDWCTRPEGAFDMEDIDWNIFKDDGYLEGPNDTNLFHYDPITTGRGVVDVLSTIIRELQEELDKYEMDRVEVEKKEKRMLELCDKLEEGEPDIPVPVELTPELIDSIIKEGMEALKKEGKSKMVVPKDYKSQMGEGFELDGDYKFREPDLRYLEIPDADRWLKYGYCDSLQSAFIKAQKVLSESYNPKDGSYDDVLIGETSDQLKDVIINTIVKRLEHNKETIEFEDEDIQMEVLDYLYKNNYRVKSIENKVSLL